MFDPAADHQMENLRYLGSVGPFAEYLHDLEALNSPKANKKHAKAVLSWARSNMRFTPADREAIDAALAS